MTVKENEEAEEEQEGQSQGHQLLNVTLAQGGALPDNRAYLDGYSTVTAFKTDKYLKNQDQLRRNQDQLQCRSGVYKPDGEIRKPQGVVHPGRDREHLLDAQAQEEISYHLR